MKKIILTFVVAGLAAGMTTAMAQTETNALPETENGRPLPPEGNAPEMEPPPGAEGQPVEVRPPEMSEPPADVNGAQPQSGTNSTSRGRRVILPSKSFAGQKAEIRSEFVPPPIVVTNTDKLILNFRNAPLEMVLNYLSDAAGFIVVLDTPVRGNVSVISKHPMTREEAADLLNSVLNQNGYAAIRDGRMLTIVDKNDAKTRNIPVKVGSNPDEIPNNDEIVTQIIPIRFVDAGSLVTDLSSFVSPQATVVANDAGNSIVITDTQSNIKHLMLIIKAIDNSAEAETVIRVFPLKYANPTDVASELSSVFPGSNSSGSQAPVRFGGGRFGRFFGGRFGGNNRNTPPASSSSERIQKATQVTAVADSRIQAVIVTAPKDLMAEIASMMTSLDVPSARDQNVYVFHLNNADPYQAMSVLQNMFQSSDSSRGSSRGGLNGQQQSALQMREQNTANTISQSSSSTSSTFSGGGRSGGRR